MTLITLIAIAALSWLQPLPEASVRQYYTNWHFHERQNQWVCWYYYKANADDPKYQRKAVYFPLDRRDDGLYYVSDDSGLVDGRMDWDQNYRSLQRESRRIRDIKIDWFDLPRFKTIFGASDAARLKWPSQPPGYIRVLNSGPAHVVPLPLHELPRKWTIDDIAELSEYVKGRFLMGCSRREIEKWLDENGIQHSYSLEIISDEMDYLQKYFIPELAEMRPEDFSGMIRAEITSPEYRTAQSSPSSDRRSFPFYFLFDRSGRYVEVWFGGVLHQF